MYHINEIPLNFEPRQKISEKLRPYVNLSYAEMSEFDSAFLCGLLTKFKPKKILEVGVAAGGSTAIILQCLHDLNANQQMHSVDILSTYWVDRTKRIGFIADIAKEILHFENHTFHLGGGFFLGWMNWVRISILLCSIRRTIFPVKSLTSSQFFRC